MTFAPPLPLSPDRMSASVQHGGSSKRGPHRLASTACERLWTLRTIYGVVTKNDPPLRLSGTLIHTCLAYHYASLMTPPPAWFTARTLEEALDKDGEGAPELIRSAKDIYQAFRHRFAGDTWRPIFVEEEFEATIGELDPGGPDTSLDSEVVTCRTDLVIESNGDLWIVDHKSTGGQAGKDRLAVWADDGEYKLNWQVLMNLHILRAPSNVAKLGGRKIRGFLIQRIKQRPPYDFDRHPISVPSLAYQVAPRAAREYVAKERDILAKINRGEAPSPNFASCYGRYGKCFPPGTIVTTAEGPRPIESIQPGVLVQTANGYRHVVRTNGRWHSGKVINLTIERRRALPIVATPEHPILIRHKDGRDTWVPIADVGIGDQVHVALHTAPDGVEPVTVREEAELMGLFLAEGNVKGYSALTKDTWRGTGLNWSYGHHESDLVDRTVALIDQLYGLKATITRKPTAFVVRMYDAEIATRFMRDFGHRAPNKQVPLRIASADRDIVLTCLAAWMLGDGGETINRVYGTSSSKRMAVQWLSILARYGIHPTAQRNTWGGGVINGRKILRRHSQFLMNFSGRAWEAIGDYVGRPHTARASAPIVERTETAALFRIIDKSVQPYSGPVYNMEVEDAHMYTADGYIVHNCDYHDLCSASSKQEQLAIMNSSFRSTHDAVRPIAGAPVTIGGTNGGGRGGAPR